MIADTDMALPAGRKGGAFLLLGGALLASFGMLALFGPGLAPAGSDEQDLFNALQPPSLAYPFGTDPLGRDMLSRIIIGARFTMVAAVGAVLLAAVAGIAMGLAAGFFRGRIDKAVTIVIDLMLTIPELIFAIAIASVIGAGMTGLILAIGITFTPQIARVVRARVFEVREELYIRAAHALGVSDGVIVLRHVLPNTVTVISIQLSLAAGQAVLVASALGFLGLGVEPPTPEWGTMLSTGRDYIAIAPHLVLVPGLAISLLVFGFNMFGDGLRDLLDPRGKE